MSQSLSKQAIEIEESYSFSLRNYQGHRTGGANPNINGRNSVTSKQGQQDQVSNSQSSFSKDERKNKISVPNNLTIDNNQVEALTLSINNAL